MKNVFVDRHHDSLFNSLIILFEKRLGWKLSTQAGMAWYQEGLWDVFPHPSTAEQYLLREVEKEHGITLEQFKDTKFDVLLCSIPTHVNIWLKLKELYQPQAKLIFQVGNVWPFDHSFPIKNILASAVVPQLMGFNVLQYHQEFDLNSFHYEPVKEGRKIYSFTNCLNTVDLYRPDWDLFLQLESLLPEWTFKSYGGQTRDGAISPLDVAAKMREATFIYQCKTKGDGFGHVIHQAAAVGRPLITRFSDYEDKLAECLIDEITSISVDHATPETIANMIRETWDSGLTPITRGKNIYQKFKDNVDFEYEAEQIKQFLEHLI